MLFKSLGTAAALSLIIATPHAANAKPGYERRVEQKLKKEKRKNTLIGAGIGLLGGAILSGGDPWATIGGAAAGGVIGNVTTKDKRDRRDDRRWRKRDRDDWRRSDRRR